MKYSLILLFLLGSFSSLIAQQTTQNDTTKTSSLSTSHTKRSSSPPPPPPPKKDDVFCVMENPHRFPGCEGKGSLDEIKKCAEGELTKFLYKNLKYPKIARDNRVEGMCVVQFIVEKDGSVSDVTLVRDIGAGCGKEAVRVVELMNKQGIKWTPGSSRGRACRMRFTLPVKFKLGVSAFKIAAKPKLPVRKEEKIKTISKPTIEISKFQIKVQHFTLSPNPNTGQFQLDFKAEPKPTILLIYNSLGQEVHKEYLDNFDGHYKNNFQLQGQGIYFVRLEQGNQSFSKQFVIVEN